MVAFKTSHGKRLHKAKHGDGVDPSKLGTRFFKYTDVQERDVILEREDLTLCPDKACRQHFSTEFQGLATDTVEKLLHDSKDGVMPVGMAIDSRAGRKLHKKPCMQEMILDTCKVVHYNSLQELQEVEARLGKERCRYCSGDLSRTSRCWMAGEVAQGASWRTAQMLCPRGRVLAH